MVIVVKTDKIFRTNDSNHIKMFMNLYLSSPDELYYNVSTNDLSSVPTDVLFKSKIENETISLKVYNNITGDETFYSNALVTMYDADFRKLNILVKPDKVWIFDFCSIIHSFSDNNVFGIHAYSKNKHKEILDTFTVSSVYTDDLTIGKSLYENYGISYYFKKLKYLIQEKQKGNIKNNIDFNETESMVLFLKKNINILDQKSKEIVELNKNIWLDYIKLYFNNGYIVSSELLHYIIDEKDINREKIIEIIKEEEKKEENTYKEKNKEYIIINEKIKENYKNNLESKLKNINEKKNKLESYYTIKNELLESINICNKLFKEEKYFEKTELYIQFCDRKLDELLLKNVITNEKKIVPNENIKVMEKKNQVDENMEDSLNVFGMYNIKRKIYAVNDSLNKDDFLGIKKSIESLKETTENIINESIDGKNIESIEKIEEKKIEEKKIEEKKKEEKKKEEKKKEEKKKEEKKKEEKKKEEKKTESNKKRGKNGKNKKSMGDMIDTSDEDNYSEEIEDDYVIDKSIKKKIKK